MHSFVQEMLVGVAVRVRVLLGWKPVLRAGDVERNDRDLETKLGHEQGRQTEITCDEKIATTPHDRPEKRSGQRWDGAGREQRA